MIFWKKKTQDENWKELLKILELMKISIAEHTAQISLINDKLIKKLSSGGSSPTLQASPPPEETKKHIYNDGFDSIREINKEDGKL